MKTVEFMIHPFNPQLEKYLNTLLEITDETALTEKESIFNLIN